MYRLVRAPEPYCYEFQGSITSQIIHKYFAFSYGEDPKKMANTHTAILNHYKIDNLYPTEWPADKNYDDNEESSDEENGLLPISKPKRVVSKSRYSVLEPRRTSVPGAERTKDGLDNLVQKDESDPLGSTTSVISVLRKQGIDIDADNKLRNRYLLSSTNFSPSLFLSQVHQDASTDDLLRGLNFLSQSIEKKSASLKVLVESNFEKFVRAKSTIDNVYREMINPVQGSSTPSVPSRSSKRRTNSGMFSPGTLNDKPKNALVKEQEFGVLPLKIPLLELKAKADEVWGPALGKRERETLLNVFSTMTEKQSSLFEASSKISESIKKRDHESLVEEYVKIKRLADEAKEYMQPPNNRNLSDEQVLQIMLTARVWSDIEDQIEVYKRDIWRRLAGTHFTKHQTSIQERDKPEEYMELIKILLELGAEENPIWVWLFSRWDYLKSKILGTFDRSKVEIEILRRRLSQGEKPTPTQIATHFKSATSDGRVGYDSQIDMPKILEVWEHIYSCLNTLLSTQGGILGEVLEFWDTAKSFINGEVQKSLPTGIDGSSRKHHRLSTEGVSTISNGAQDLVNMIRKNLLSFFIDAPAEDLSVLLSDPKLQSPNPKSPHTPKSLSNDTRLRIDPINIPPPSPRKGESWEKFAFWPPYANSLSGVHYLSKILHLIGTATCDMASLDMVEEKSESVNNFKTLLGNIRDRCVQAACAAWSIDCDQVILLEDWSRELDRPDLTNLPGRLMNFEGFLLHNLQKILFIPEATKRQGSPDIIVPPSSKLLQMVRLQFVGGIYKIINSMTDNAEAISETEQAGPDKLATPIKIISTGQFGYIDPNNRNVRILLTLSNIQCLRNDIMPHLLTIFETNFTIKLTDDTASIRDALSKIDSRLFQDYVSPHIQESDKLIRNSIGRVDWAPKGSRPIDARPYVYKLLLGLVLVHSEVHTTTTPLTSPILKHLLEKYLSSFLDAFKQRTAYSLSALMQATLDVEFMAQTLSNYTTEKASGIQSDIYGQLDELTDNDTRVKLQQEGLKELKVNLKNFEKQQKQNLHASNAKEVLPKPMIVQIS